MTDGFHERATHGIGNGLMIEALVVCILLAAATLNIDRIIAVLSSWF